MEIILASNSPRRRELLENMGVKFTAVSPDFDEDSVNGLSPTDTVERLALGKAESIAKDNPDAIVIGSDTIVDIDGEILGKPKDASDAKRMITLLSGRTHSVCTGLAIVRGDKKIVTHEVTKVTFKKLAQDEIDGYVASGEPMDKAGSYGIQKLGSMLVERIDGDFFTVVGFPVCKTAQILRDEWGIKLLERQ